MKLKVERLKRAELRQMKNLTKHSILWKQKRKMLWVVYNNLLKMNNNKCIECCSNENNHPHRYLVFHKLKTNCRKLKSRYHIFGFQEH